MKFFLLLLLLWHVVDGTDAVHASTSPKDAVSSLGSEASCCKSARNYSSYSIVDALNIVTNDTIINVSTDDVLFLNVTLKGVSNIAIVGKGNPTVNCNDMGSLKFVSCNNVTIKGINWERCGSFSNPGIEFYDASNIAIRHCSFSHSKSKAFMLSKVSGNVSINNCQFSHSKLHQGHGAVIYYTSSYKRSAQLVISNCNFTLNGPADSIVYIDGSHKKLHGQFSTLQNSTFIQNQGVPLYISNTTLILNSIVSFEDNKATAGGAIYSSKSIIKFDDKCNVSFDNNSANHYGGAVVTDNSLITFNGNSTVKFINNSATKVSGGAIDA